ncbi:MAG: NIF family HAD-type phosphatase [Fimbriiglobus sp.]
MKHSKVLALDLERTLLDDARSGQPRPGLRAFLNFCHEHFARVAIFTTVETTEAQAVLADLDDRGFLPKDLTAKLEFIEWCGEYKDLAFVPDAKPDDIRLVDDDSGWIRPDQRDQWIPIAPWDGGSDHELASVQRLLNEWLNQVS